MWSQIDCLGIADLYGCCAGYVFGCCWETGPDPVDVNRRLLARCCLATIGTEASGRSDRSDELDQQGGSYRICSASFGDSRFYSTYSAGGIIVLSYSGISVLVSSIGSYGISSASCYLMILGDSIGCSSGWCYEPTTRFLKVATVIVFERGFLCLGVVGWCSCEACEVCMG